MGMDIFGELTPSFGGGADTFGQLMLLYLSSMLMSSVISIASYVLSSLGCYTIAKRRGIHNPWLAWIPIANLWILGSISDQYQYVAKGKVKNRRKVLIGLPIAITVAVILIIIGMVVFAVSAGVGVMSGGDSAALSIGLAVVLVLAYLAVLVLGIILAVFQYIACYDLYASCSPDNAVIFLVLSIFINITMPIFIFAVRNKDGGMPPRREEQPAPQLEAEATYTQMDEIQ